MGFILQVQQIHIIHIMVVVDFSREVQEVVEILLLVDHHINAVALEEEQPEIIILRVIPMEVMVEVIAEEAGMELRLNIMEKREVHIMVVQVRPIYREHPEIPVTVIL